MRKWGYLHGRFEEFFITLQGGVRSVHPRGVFTMGDERGFPSLMKRDG